MKVINKNNLNTIVIYTFDDFYSKWQELGELLNQYNIKGTFFIMSNDLAEEKNIDLINNLIKLKHEISNHTHTHLLLENNNIEKFIEEYNLCDKYLKEIFGINNLSFAFVGGQLLEHNCLEGTNNLFTRPIRATKKLWKQVYRQKSNFEYNFIPIIEYDTAKPLNNFFEENKINIFFGHSIDGEGYRPIKKETLEFNLNFVKNKKNIYIDTFTSVFSYIYLLEHQKIIMLKDNEFLTIYKLKNENVNKIHNYCDYLSFKISDDYYLATINSKQIDILIVDNIKMINIPINLLNSNIFLYKIEIFNN
jgi:peptidoglycan/xylan/chitin deacetylase (PgdA/CDA1 family)